jgi:hypothetical protein
MNAVAPVAEFIARPKPRSREYWALQDATEAWRSAGCEAQLTIALQAMGFNLHFEDATAAYLSEGIPELYDAFVLLLGDAGAARLNGSSLELYEEFVKAWNEVWQVSEGKLSAGDVYVMLRGQKKQPLPARLRLVSLRTLWRRSGQVPLAFQAA